MAKRRKKRRQNPFHIAVRRSRGSEDVINSVFQTASWDQFQELLNWTYLRYRNNNMFRGLAPQTSTQLANWIYFNFESPSDSFKWVAAVTRFRFTDIKKFNVFVLEAEKAGTDFSKIFSITDAVLRETMISFAGLGPLLFSLSKSEGLDAHRRWMNENLYTPRTSLLNVIHYYKGMASESGRDPQDIYGTMYASFLARINDDIFAEMINHLIFGFPVGLKSFSDIAQLLANQPIIDQYELAANAICSNQHFLTDVNDNGLDLFLSCMSESNDWRAQGIEHLAGELRSDVIFLPLSDARSTTYFDELLGQLTESDFNEREFRTALADKFFLLQSTPSSFLASSCYLLKGSDTIEQFLRGVSRREIAQAFRNSASPSSIGRREVHLRFDNLLNELNSIPLSLEKRELFRLVCLAGIKEDRVSDILVCLYETTQKDRDAYTYFPASKFFSQYGEDVIAEVSTDPRIPIAISRIRHNLPEEGESVLYLAVEFFLEISTKLRPSELEVEPGPISEFLFEACTLETLRQSLEFTSKIEVEEERLIILRKLVLSDSENKERYEKEAHSIVGQQTVGELLQRYEVGKIHCDEKAIFRWAKEELAAKFLRLKDFIEAGLPPVEQDADVEFLAHISAGNEETFIFKVPNSEALDIARSIVSELANKYALDPLYGIDSYLSLGMRHGALVAHLRSPLSNRNILTSMGPTGYDESAHWKQFFLNIGHPQIGEDLSRTIVEFSKKYDATLQDIKDELIQVKRKEKPRGIIDLDWQESSLLSFASTFTKFGTLDEFLEDFSTVHWSLVELNLKKSRQKIISEIGPTVLSLLDDLEKDVSAATGQVRLGPFSDELTRSREELQSAIQDLASWHNVARSTDSEPIALNDIISAAQKIVARLYPEFAPNLSVVGDRDFTLSSALHILIEVFKALFINVHVHSNTIRPDIQIDIDAGVSDQLVVEFASACNDIESGEKSAKAAHERITTGEYKTRLPKEGGSGLAKVARATVKDGRPNTIVFVDCERSMFCVQMTFNLLNI